MTYTQHPLSAAFPAMTAEEVDSRLNGEIPSDKSFIDAVTASDWFKTLNVAQRAMYVVSWYHWCDKGSNQYKKKISTRSPRYAAEVAQQVIQRAAA